MKYSAEFKTNKENNHENVQKWESIMFVAISMCYAAERGNYAKERNFESNKKGTRWWKKNHNIIL